MPYPNEHAARINNPDKYAKLRRENDKFGKGIDVIWGVKDSGTTEVQAIRFDKEKFSPEQAKKWLKDHNYSGGFEEAKEQKTDACMKDAKVEKAEKGKKGKPEQKGEMKEKDKDEDEDEEEEKDEDEDEEEEEEAEED